MIPLSVPHISGNEWEYVKECLDTAWVSTAGAYVGRFEDSICKFTGAAHAVACVNGTAALHISLIIAGVEAGDEVLVPTLTFIAPVNTIRYLHAEPVFMDCDDYYNIDAQKTVEFIRNETDFRDGFTVNRQSGKRIKAIIPVHVFGNAVALEELVAICRERNIRIVEDASESLGTTYTEGEYALRHTGTIGDLGCFSFNGNKIITTGGGGMIVTDNAEYAEKARYLTTQAKDDAIRYVHDEVGYNFRLTNVQAAMGVAQMETLPEYLDCKRANFMRYREEIQHISGLTVAETPAYAESNYWFYALQIDTAVYGKDVENTMAFLGEKKIQTRPLWHLNHLQKPYQSCQHYKIEKAFDLAAKTLNIPCSVNLTDQDIRAVVGALNS